MKRKGLLLHPERNEVDNTSDNQFLKTHMIINDFIRRMFDGKTVNAICAAIC